MLGSLKRNIRSELTMTRFSELEHLNLCPSNYFIIMSQVFPSPYTKISFLWNPDADTKGLFCLIMSIVIIA